MNVIVSLSSGAIGALIVFLLVVVRERADEKKRFLAILKAEIAQNREFLVSNRKGGKLYYREDGWLAFRNQEVLSDSYLPSFTTSS